MFYITKTNSDSFKLFILIKYLVETNEQKTNLKHHSGLFQKVRPHVGSNDAVFPVKSNLDVLPKATAVVVSRRLGVSYSLQPDANLSMRSFLDEIQIGLGVYRLADAR